MAICSKLCFTVYTDNLERLNRHCLNLIGGVQNNYILKNFPVSIALNIINNSKRSIKARGSVVFAEGERFNGNLNLLLAGEVRMCKRYEMLSTEHAELIEDSETTNLFKSRVEYYVKPVGIRQKGEFLEQDIINISGRRQESAIVDSEAALLLSVDLNLILAIDKTFSLVNNLSDNIIYRQDEKLKAEQRVKRDTGLQTGPSNINSTDEAAKLAKIKYDTDNEDSYVYRISHGMKERPQEVRIRPGFNTLITKAIRSKDRSLLANAQAEREERKRISNSPALNKTLYEKSTPKKRGHRSFFITQGDQAALLGRSLSKDTKESRNRERIERVVKDRLDADDNVQDMLADDGKAISKLGLNISTKSS